MAGEGGSHAGYLSPLAGRGGAKPAPDLAVMTAGAELRFASGCGLMSKFDGEFGQGTQTYSRHRARALPEVMSAVPAQGTYPLRPR